MADSRSGAPETPRSGTQGSSPGANSSTARAFLERPIAIVTLIGAVIALIFVIRPNWAPERTPPPPPGVHLADVDLDREKNIQADWEAGSGERSTGNTPASSLTAIVRNEAENPALIKQADFKFDSADPVGCPYGGGGSSVKARYDIKVPGDSKFPSTISRKMKYDIPPHEQERIGFTVGPTVLYEGSLPVVYRFTLTLRLSDGKALQIPKVSYMNPAGAEGALYAARQAVEGGGGFVTTECVKEQEAAIGEILKSSELSSPELRKFHAELRKLAKRA